MNPNPTILAISVICIGLAQIMNSIAIIHLIKWVNR